MEKYVDERALRHFRDKAMEVDLQPKIDKLQSDLNSAKASLTERMDGYVEQLCRVETKGAVLSFTSTTVRLPFAGLYSARLVVWINGTTSSVSGDPRFSISVSGTVMANNFVQVSLGGGNETASGSIALDIMPMTPVGKLRPFNVVANGCVRVGDDVTLVQNATTVNSSSQADLVITIAPTSAIGGVGGGSVARCGYSYSALYDAESLVGA